MCKHIVPRCRPPDHQPTTTTGHHTTCCILQSYAPDDGQKFYPKHVELMLKINKYCYLLLLVGLDFITWPTLKMRGQTQIKNIHYLCFCTPVSVCCATERIQCQVLSFSGCHKKEKYSICHIPFILIVSEPYEGWREAERETQTEEENNRKDKQKQVTLLQIEDTMFPGFARSSFWWKSYEREDFTKSGLKTSK
jgi:hypothetical protein